MIKSLTAKIFEKSLVSPTIFRTAVRPVAYIGAKGDPEKVHELALEMLNEYESVIAKRALEFRDGSLMVRVNGKKVMPFTTSAGLDKNGLALKPLGHIFDIQTIGTVIVHPREGNKRPRVCVDDSDEIIYNAQGFPHQGLEKTLDNVRAYREGGGLGFLIASICGLPTEADKIDIAYEEVAQLAGALRPYVDGFEWKPFSPNTDALKMLRTPEAFKKTAEIIAHLAPNHLRLVKMGPYDNNAEQRDKSLELQGAWLMNGGQGITEVNTYMIGRENLPPKHAEGWGYKSAGASNVFLQSYRQRAIEDTRKEFPSAFISATGGINSADEAWKSFEAGANIIGGYSPYTFSGFGLIIQMKEGIKKKLHSQGYATLAAYIRSRKSAAVSESEEETESEEL